MARRKMPFGQFRGQAIKEVPGPYLRYLLRNVGMYDDLREGIELELYTRELVSEAARVKALLKEKRRVKKNGV